MNSELISKIVALFHGGASVNRIALSLGVSCCTVKRRWDTSSSARRSCSGARSPHAAEQARSLRAGDRRLAAALSRHLGATHPRGVTRARLSGRLHGLLNGCSACVPRRRRRCAETSPGEQGQMDYSTGTSSISLTRAAAAFVFQLRARLLAWQYLHFVERRISPRRKVSTSRAFAHLGGVAAMCLYDNMKVVVSGYDATIGPQPAFSRLRGSALRVSADRLPRATPQTKGKVERPFGYVESSLLGGGRTFRDREHLNETAAWWLAEVADIAFTARSARPIDRHAEELSSSDRASPAMRGPFDAAEVVLGTVDAEGFVVYRQNFYAGPLATAGARVAAGVRVTDEGSGIHDQDFVEATRHPLFPRCGWANGVPVRSTAYARRATTERATRGAVRRIRARRACGSWRVCSPATASARTESSRCWRRCIRADVLAGRAAPAAARQARSASKMPHPCGRGRPKTLPDLLADDHRTYLERFSTRGRLRAATHSTIKRF